MFEQNKSILLFFQCLPGESRVMRVMPNTPALVRSGASVFVRGAKTTEDDVKITKKLLNSIGTSEEVSETLMNPITALSGSGPAYVSDYSNWRETMISYHTDTKTNNL